MAIQLGLDAARIASGERLGAAGTIVGVAISAAALFMVYPALDLDIARLMYLGDRQFVGKPSPVTSAFREVFRWSYGLCAVMAIGGLIMTRRKTNRWLGLAFVQWLFLATCLWMGPGVVANLTLKDHSGRARPREVVELGGTKAFTPPLVRSYECNKNCSFVSGEASSMFAMFFAGAVLWPRRSRALIAAGIVAGAGAGFVRMAQGAHFFSDVLFAGIFMAMTVWLIHWTFITIAEAPRRPLLAT